MEFNDANLQLPSEPVDGTSYPINQNDVLRYILNLPPNEQNNLLTKVFAEVLGQRGIEHRTLLDNADALSSITTSLIGEMGKIASSAPPTPKS